MIAGGLSIRTRINLLVAVPYAAVPFILFTFANIPSFAQTTSTTPTSVDLSAPSLAANAKLPINELFGVPLTDSLVDGHETAISKGLPWTGMDYIVTDDVGGMSSIAALLKLYQKIACQADAIAVGHTSLWAAHLSASRTAVYSDYVFVIDALLKDNKTFPIRSRPDIVVTRPGGLLSLPEGPVKFDFQSFPGLRAGATYLQFLRYVPESSAYHPYDSFSTLIATGSNWAIARKALSAWVIPGFTRGALESSIGEWLKSCQ